MNIETPWYPYQSGPHIKQSPTDSQIKALGLLMLTHKVHYEDGLPMAEMQELVDMHLCVFKRHPLVFNSRWVITSRLLRQWASYRDYAAQYHKCVAQLAAILPPVFLTEDHQIQFVDNFTPAINFMQMLVLETGRNLATHWQAWKMEDADRASY